MVNNKELFAKVLSFVFVLSLFVLSMNSAYGLGEYEYRNVNIPFTGYKIKMIFGEEGGGIDFDIESNVPVDVYITDEKHLDALKDYVHGESDDFSTILEKVNVVQETISIECKESMNYLIFIENSGVHKETSYYKTARVNMTVNSEAPEETFLSKIINVNLLLLLLIPVAVLIPIAVWIRKKV